MPEKETSEFDLLSPEKDFNLLSLPDLLEARDHYHVHLMHKENVVATALGKYRIRVTDPWPTSANPHPRAPHSKKARTLSNSEVRPYSWPCVLVFVSKWVQPDDFTGRGRYHPDQMVPRALYLPDGRVVPVCVVEAPRNLSADTAAPAVEFPTNNIGGGYPVLADVQGAEHVASIACLVTDGHRTYGLTNRHVCGEPGETLYSRLDGKKVPIGTSSPRQLTRRTFQEVYADWPGKEVFVNLDVGLIDIEDVNAWSARVRRIGTIGNVADLSAQNISLRLVGCPVVAFGCASGLMEGEIHGLFYRYKAVGGFEYVADLLLGARSAKSTPEGPTEPEPFATRHGDSGTLWLLDDSGGATVAKKKDKDKSPLRPLAVQWGGQVFTDAERTGSRPYALATYLSTVCNLLEIDPVPDWNVDQPEYWGAVGHYSIAASVADALSSAHPRLLKLMANNRTVISYEDDQLLTSDFKNQTSAEWVPLADVPDNVWKHGTQGFARKFEGPNHFADMDQPRPGDGMTLLHLCEDENNIDPSAWDLFYESVRDLLSGEKIEYEHRGLLPFRVRQIFEAMVKFVQEERFDEFVCAAGILTHYVGDACQPLHVSYLHDGDPADTVEKMVYNRKTHKKELQPVPRAAGVHAAYETAMVSENRQAILRGLDKTPKVKAGELLTTGKQAAAAVVALMRRTIKRLEPMSIVTAYLRGKDGEKSRTKAFWAKFGQGTIDVMQGGVHLLAILWESAWVAGGGEKTVSDQGALTQDRAKEIYQSRAFLPSFYIDKIGGVLG
jgi:hypothetical protein